MISIRKNRFVFLMLLFSCVFLAGCDDVKEPSVTIDLPEGFAPQRLKDFAKQANVEIVFIEPSILNVKTNAVAGDMTPDEALKAMLRGSGLVIERDMRSGAFAVTGETGP